MEDSVILDMETLIDVLRGQKGVKEFVEGLEEDYTLCTTVITSFEHHHGAWKTENPPRNLQAVETLLGRLNVHDFTSEAAELSGKILAYLEKEGRTIGLRDVFIAAIAFSLDSWVKTHRIRSLIFFAGHE